MASTLAPAVSPTPEPKAPGVDYGLGDYFGWGGKNKVPPEHPLNAAKGDLGEMNIPGLETQALTHPGLPFVLSDTTKKR
jgi:hypothetical protein